MEASPIESLALFLKEFASDIMAKKELSNLNTDFVQEKVTRLFSLNEKLKKRVLEKFEKCSYDYEKFKRTKERDELLKKARSELREIYGVFVLEDEKKKRSLLESLIKNPTAEANDRILEAHKSTNERLQYYDLVYKKIFEITGIPKSIVDLACGLNPFSYPYLGCKPDYLACDISDEDLKFIAEYFKAMNINGKTLRIDLVKDNNDVICITKGKDVCFLFKALDTLEAAKRNISRELLKNVQSSHAVVSFATKSIGGRKSIRKERRAWFEKIVAKNGWKSSVFELPNEIFYIIQK
jgi:hypothetical protein